MKRWLVAMSMVATAVGATTLVALDVAGLTRGSDVIVRGTVKTVAPRWTKDGARIITDAEIDVAQTLKGTTTKTVIAMQPGGELGEVGQRVDGVARFAPGEEVVLFLEARGDRFTVAGMAQGKFRVERSSDGKAAFVRQDDDGAADVVDPLTRQVVAKPPATMTLQELERQVRAAIDAPVIAPPVMTRPPVKVTP